MKNSTLDPEEQELLDAFEAGEFHSVLTPERKQFLESSAQHTCELNQAINIQVSSTDLTALQKVALQQGIPYPLLISSILHKYASGMLYEVSYSK
jgi:predicted DNA binding CopG/RHH family protein